MSSDAKVWLDNDGWHGICDSKPGEKYHGTNYELTWLLIEIEHDMKQKLHWEIFEFGNGLGLRGFRAKP